MDREDLHLVPRRELAAILDNLKGPALRGVLLLGEPGTGKTTLLAMAAQELSSQGRPVFEIPLGSVRYPGDLGVRLLNAIAASPYKDAVDVERTLRSSHGDVPLTETAAILNRASARLPSPVLLMDALDESVFPNRVASAIEQLSLELDDWKFVVASRLGAAEELRRLRSFSVLELRGLAGVDAVDILRASAPSLPADIIARITEFTGGNPVLLQAVARDLQRSASLATAGDGASSLADALEWLVNEAVSESADPAKLGELLEDLALAGGRDRIAALAVKSRIADGEVSRLLDAPRARALVVLDDPAGMAALFHDALRDVIMSRRVLTSPFRLADLRFGDEEAEGDELLDKTYVHRPHVEAILGQKRPVVVGDRGSGKSAIFRKLAAGAASADGYPHVVILPVAKPYNLLHKIIVDEAAWLDTHKIRAAWLVVVASMVGSVLPPKAPKKLRRDAVGIRAALGLPVPPASFPRRAFDAAARLLGGTTLKLTAGPAQVEVKLPSGSGARPGKAPVDVDRFLKEANNLLGESGRRAVVMADQIDEIAKGNLDKQKAVVRGLLQAVREVHPREHIQFVVFLRTDLYQRCDAQEKTKLVSKTVTLTWEEEDWLQVLVRRVLANEPFQRLASRLRGADGSTDITGALQVLFPPEIEGQPADRWLIDSLRNGNGSVSPRLAVNLLFLAGQQAARPTDSVSTLPLFSADEAGQAMTKLSDLSFDEVVSDFQVAPSFVLSCRTGKLETFAQDEVQELFNEADGNKEEQVLLLERLGFLERIVRERDSMRESLFHIPSLYTRCWDHA